MAATERLERQRRAICRVQSRICVGGPARQTILLASGLRSSGYWTLLIGGGLEPDEEDLTDEARRQRVPTLILHDMQRRINPIKDFKAFLRLRHIFKLVKPVLVHTHTAKAGTIGRLAAITTGVPVIVHTFHGHIFDGYFSRPAAGVFKMIERVLARFTTRILTISTTLKQDICWTHRICPPEKVDVIPLGIQLDGLLRSGDFRGELRQELGIDEKTPLIGFVGRLTDVKDPGMLLQALRQMQSPVAGVPDPHLVLAGTGELRQPLEALTRELRIQDRVTFLGYRSDLERIYADLDVLALTSKNEGTPVALIEAMAAGIPIVAADVGGVSDVTQGYPLATTVADRTPEALAAALERRIADRPARIDGGPYVRRYSAERLLSDIEDLYDELLTEHPLPSAEGDSARELPRAA